jgi:hypothetical protein
VFSGAAADPRHRRTRAGVPELTCNAGIQINERVSLRHQPFPLSIVHRTNCTCPGPHQAKPPGEHIPLGGFVVRQRKTAVFNDLKKCDWAIVALCLAASIVFGIYSVKLAIDYRAKVNAPAVTRLPDSR